MNMKAQKEALADLIAEGKKFSGVLDAELLLIQKSTKRDQSQQKINKNCFITIVVLFISSRFLNDEVLVSSDIKERTNN